MGAWKGKAMDNMIKVGNKVWFKTLKCNATVISIDGTTAYIKTEFYGYVYCDIDDLEVINNGSKNEKSKK